MARTLVAVLLVLLAVVAATSAVSPRNGRNSPLDADAHASMLNSFPVGGAGASATRSVEAEVPQHHRCSEAERQAPCDSAAAAQTVCGLFSECASGVPPCGRAYASPCAACADTAVRTWLDGACPAQLPSA